MGWGLQARRRVQVSACTAQGIVCALSRQTRRCLCTRATHVTLLSVTY